MCDYEHEYSFVFDDAAFENESSSCHWDSGFESMWQQIGEELRQERETHELGQLFQEKLMLDSWKF